MNIINYGKSIVAEEIKCIQDLQHSIDQNFENVVNSIFNIKGKLVICGIGKSADIGKKIVATLNSTGTSACFLHAADAIHGDLGIINKEDIILIISKSGESGEILHLIPILKSFGNTIIAMVSNIKSTLALQANMILNTSISNEAGEHNLAPTSSTTCQLVMGDALAMCLMKMKNISTNDFARVHPGGALGKKLLVTIQQIIPKNHAPFVLYNQNIKEIIIEISKGRLGAVAVLDTSKKIIGIITDGDIRRTFEKQWSENMQAKEMMNAAPKTILETSLASHALEIMNQQSISQLIVTNASGAYKSIVHLHDILKEGIL